MGKKMRDIIHYFLMHIVLHTYIMAHTLTEDWPHFTVQFEVEKQNCSEELQHTVCYLFWCPIVNPSDNDRLTSFPSSSVCSQ